MMFLNHLREHIRYFIMAGLYSLYEIMTFANSMLFMLSIVLLVSVAPCSAELTSLSRMRSSLTDIYKSIA